MLPYFIAADEETKSVVLAIRGGRGVAVNERVMQVEAADPGNSEHVATLGPQPFWRQGGTAWLMRCEKCCARCSTPVVLPNCCVQVRSVWMMSFAICCSSPPPWMTGWHREKAGMSRRRR